MKLHHMNWCAGSRTKPGWFRLGYDMLQRNTATSGGVQAHAVLACDSAVAWVLLQGHPTALVSARETGTSIAAVVNSALRQFLGMPTPADDMPALLAWWKDELQRSKLAGPAAASPPCTALPAAETPCTGEATAQHGAETTPAAAKPQRQLRSRATAGTPGGKTPAAAGRGTAGAAQLQVPVLVLQDSDTVDADAFEELVVALHEVRVKLMHPHCTWCITQPPGHQTTEPKTTCTCSTTTPCTFLACAIFLPPSGVCARRRLRCMPAFAMLLLACILHSLHSNTHYGLRLNHIYMAAGTPSRPATGACAGHHHEPPRPAAAAAQPRHAQHPPAATVPAAGTAAACPPLQVNCTCSHTSQGHFAKKNDMQGSYFNMHVGIHT